MEINVKITRKKIKSLILKITPDGEVLLSAPIRVSNEVIQSFLKKREEWIIQKLKERLEYKKKQVGFLTGEIIFYLGEKYTLEIIDAKKSKVFTDGEKIYIYCPNTTDTAGRRKIFEEWGAERLSILLKELTLSIGKKIGYLPNEIRIKNMKSRWGSCHSSKKVVTYNLQLMYKPLSVIEYVVLHELAHIPHPHHQKEFWNFVEKYMPDWKIQRKLLNNSHLL